MLFQKLMGKGPTSMISPSAPKTLWTWGRADFGQLGQPDTVRRSSPVQIGNLATWSQIADTSNHSLALKTDGTLWSWGYGIRGQLGLGDIINRSSPVQVGGMMNWSQVTSGGGTNSSLSIKIDGTLWSWGMNAPTAYGVLGLGDAISRSSPVQVGTLATWSKISQGTYSASAIKTDGTLWAWGYNSNRGQLGLGDITNRSSPVQVGTLATWALVARGTKHTLAIKTDGTLWAWGGNNFTDVLGLGDAVYRSSPVQVGTLTTWSQAAGGGTTSLAVRNDRTLWTWGDNANGRLGLGDTAPRSSPVQVGTLAVWAQIVAGRQNSLAIKTDGTLWSWGRNANYGQLGLGDILERSSPVQVGTLATWTNITGGYHITALRV